MRKKIIIALVVGILLSGCAPIKYYAAPIMKNDYSDMIKEKCTEAKYLIEEIEHYEKKRDEIKSSFLNCVLAFDLPTSNILLASASECENSAKVFENQANDLYRQYYEMDKEDLYVNLRKRKWLEDWIVANLDYQLNFTKQSYVYWTKIKDEMSHLNF